jgi:DNA mismatch endonuclease, patch repair protein
MVDVHDKKTRSYNMSRIRGKDTKPEFVVRKMCHGLGLRFRLHRKDLPGKPDLTFPKYRIALFVNGCFWHSHNCKYGAIKPKTNSEFWSSKRLRTVERDQENRDKLLQQGWLPIVIWECETKDSETLLERLSHAFFNGHSVRTNSG